MTTIKWHLDSPPDAIKNESKSKTEKGKPLRPAESGVDSWPLKSYLSNTVSEN
jgi:hypothetical protein